MKYSCSATNSSTLNADCSTTSIASRIDSRRDRKATIFSLMDSVSVLARSIEKSVSITLATSEVGSRGDDGWSSTVNIVVVGWTGHAFSKGVSGQWKGSERRLLLRHRCRC